MRGIPRDPTTRPSLEILDKLAWKVVHCWMSLGEKLGVCEPTIERISRSPLHITTKERAFQLLEVWRDEGGTFEKLAKGLKSVGMDRLVEIC